MRNFLFLCVVQAVQCMNAQVGIGTATPSEAAMLEVSSTSDNGASFKGFMPPRVPTSAERDAINPLTGDTGLIVFVENPGCLQLWNGSGWEDLHCIHDAGFDNSFQNFDLNTTWGYVSDVPFFNNGANGFYGITNAANGGFSNLTTLTNNFLGIKDLDDEGNNGTPGFANIAFNTINVAAAAGGVVLSFDYEFFEFDTGDDAFYTITIDGIPQAEVQLINGAANLSLSGTASLSIPGGSSTVGLSIRIKQNGADDYAGFDNFSVVNQ